MLYTTVAGDRHKQGSGLGLAIRAATQAPNLVVLDLGLPDADGKAILSELRAWSQVPVIVLTVRDAEGETVQG